LWVREETTNIGYYKSKLDEMKKRKDWQDLVSGEKKGGGWSERRWENRTKKK
jgi:hypothetical protein